MVDFDWEMNTKEKKNKEQLDRIEKKIDELDRKLDKHIEEIWTVYVPIKRLLEKLERFRLW
tara:strand:- start:198 stop:380 length:183 start_codon:yes stop_codon:yes gene_type:complete